MTLIASEQGFAEWLAYMNPSLAGFEDFAMPIGWTAGFTRESLVELETYLLDRWTDEGQYNAGVDPNFVDGAGRYLGETYLRLAGGGWDILTETGSLYSQRPFVQTDVSEGVPLAPYLLLPAAVQRRTGTEFSSVYDYLARRVDARRQDRGPSWQPARLPVPGVTEGTAAEEESTPEAREWVGSVEDRIVALRQRLGPDVASQLDLSPASLAVAEEAALADFGRDDTDDRSPSELHQQYVAYVGETLLRAAGGRWILRPGDPEDNIYLGNPYVYRDRRGNTRAAVPLHKLQMLLKDRQPGVFDRALKNYSKGS